MGKLSSKQLERLREGAREKLQEVDRLKRALRLMRTGRHNAATRAGMRSDINRLQQNADGMLARVERQSVGVGVSDHALIRYLERVYGLDIDLLRAEVLPPEVAPLAGVVQDGEIDIDGPLGRHVCLMRSGIVTTVVTSES